MISPPITHLIIPQTFIKVYYSNMSYSRKSKPVMHCKVCESARKSPQMIASHYPKNKDGFVICPTLLFQECRACGKRGHTVKYCPTSNAVAMLQVVVEKKKEKQVTTTKKVVINSRSFAAVMEDDSEEEQEQEEKQEPVAVKMSIKTKDTKPKDTKPKDTKPKEVIPFSWANPGTDSEGDESESD